MLVLHTRVTNVADFDVYIVTTQILQEVDNLTFYEKINCESLKKL